MITATAIIKDMSEQFYNGFPGHAGFLDLDAAGKWDRVCKMHRDPAYKCTIKIGNGSFRDQVELNGLKQRGGRVITCKLEPRKGYKLATFEFA